MIRFSANLGFLWTDRPLPAAIEAAAAAGFDAVECHMPYAFDPADVRETLRQTGLSMVSLNTRFGDRDGDFGVAALPGREAEAQAAIDEAIDYAVAIECPNVSVLAGRSGRTEESERVYRSNLQYAAETARAADRIILIEPLNTNVAADYHLVTVGAAVATIEALNADNIRIMVDCFHSATMEGDLDPVFDAAWPHLGHVQISAHPDRGEPVGGTIDYHDLLPRLAARGWSAPFGAEYTPRGDIGDGLGWLATWHNTREEHA